MHVAICTLDADEFSRHQLDLPGRHGTDQPVVQLGREAVTMIIPPRAQVLEKLPLGMVGPTLPKTLIKRSQTINNTSPISARRLGLPHQIAEPAREVSQACSKRNVG